MSHAYDKGRRTVLAAFGLAKAGASAATGTSNQHPLLKGIKVDTAAPDVTDRSKPYAPEKAPTAKVWPPPPHATSGALLNPKVA